MIDRSAGWEAFREGCAEPLRISHIDRVTDGSGDGFHSVADLMHEES